MYIDMSDDPEKHDLHFVGKIGQFTPVKKGGGIAYVERTASDGTIKYDSISGTKDYKWMDTEEFLKKGGTINDVDTSYYDMLAN